MAPKVLALLCAVLLVACPVVAKSQEPLSEEFRADILKLLEVTGSRNIGLQMGNAMAGQMIDMVQQMKPQVSDRAAEVIKDEIAKILKDRLEELINEMVPIYSKYLTQAEVRTLVSFFESPTGQKYIACTPLMMSEGMQVGQAWGERLAPEIEQRITDRLKAESILE